MVESAALPPGTVRFPAERLQAFAVDVFRALGVPDADAELIADVLVSADRRGIRSHGVARIPYFFVRIRKQGTVKPAPEMTYRRGSDTTGVLDAGDGIGIVAARLAMDHAVEMSLAHGSGFVAVANSSHFGYAGYWAARAAAAGCVGISMSNSAGRTAPTFGAGAILGTNPLSVTMPARTGGTDFYLDMATSTVAVGKIETALREGRPVPAGWVLDEIGAPALDDRGVLGYQAPLLPLGGAGDQTGGHKGYGLMLMIELLCGALSGTGLAARIAGADGSAPAAMAHLFGALRIDGFRPLEEVQNTMEDAYDVIRGSAKLPGHDRILIPGEPELMAEERHATEGLPVTPPVLDQLRAVDRELGLGSGI